MLFCCLLLDFLVVIDNEKGKTFNSYQIILPKKRYDTKINSYNHVNVILLQSGSESQYFSSSSEAYHSDGSESGDYVFDDFINFMNSKYSVNDILQYNSCLEIIVETCIIICLAHKCINCLVL